MFWTRVSKALSDILIVVALVMALMLGEGFAKMLDSFMAGVMGCVIGIVITLSAGVAMKSLTKTSDTIINLLNKLEGNAIGKVAPMSLEDVEELEKHSEAMMNNDGEDNNSNDSTGSSSIVNTKWKSLRRDIKAVWIEVIAVMVGTMILSFKVSEKTQYGAILILGFGLVLDMLINAIVGTAVENHHKMERVNHLMKTRNERKNK